MPERGTSVLVVGHDLALIKRMKKRVRIPDHGKLMDDVSPATWPNDRAARKRRVPASDALAASASGSTSTSTASSPASAAYYDGPGPPCSPSG